MLKVNQLAIKEYLLSKGISFSEKQVNVTRLTSNYSILSDYFYILPTYIG